jgi:CMP/dCMP kinase
MIITISGTPGSGKTTIANAVAKKFKITAYSIGNIMKKTAEKQGISLQELNKKAKKDKKIDEFLDSELIKKAKKNKNIVLTTRTGFHFIPDSIKLFIKCDPEIAAERIIKDVKKGKRKSESEIKEIKEAIASIKKRMKEEKERYKKHYGINITDEKNYDFVLDTSNLNKEKAIEKIIEFIKTKF